MIRLFGKRTPKLLLGANIILAASYFLTAKLSFLLTTPPDKTSPIWIPSGICLIFALAFGWRIAPGILLGRALLMLQGLLSQQPAVHASVPLYFALLTPIASTIESIAAAYLMRGVLKTSRHQHSWKTILFTTSIILLTANIPALTNTAGMFIYGGSPSSSFISHWINWAYGDALGMLVFLPFAVMFFNSPSRNSLLKLFRFLAPASLFLLLVFAAYWLVEHYENERIKQAFDRQTDSISQQMQSEVENFFSDLRLVIPRLERKDHIDKELFESIAAPLLQEHPKLQAFNWIPIIRKEDISHTQALLSAEYGKPFNFTRRIGEDIIPLPTPLQEPAIAPIIYSAPQQDNLIVLGLDLSIFANKAIREATNSGQPFILRPIRIVQETGNQKAIVCYYPIRQDNWEKISNEGPSNNYGLFNIVWRMDDFLMSFAKRDFNSGIQLELWDNCSENITQCIAAIRDQKAITSTITSAYPKPPSTFRRHSSFPFINHEWTLVASASPQFFAANKSGASRIVLLGGVLISTLLGFLSFSNFNRNNEIETQVEKQTRELRASQEKALHLAQAKSEFLAIMSHEIRTPMNGIIATAHLIQQSGLNKDQSEMLQILQNSSAHLLHLINEILDFSKLEAGKTTLHIVPFNPGDILQRAQQTLANLASQKGIKFTIEDHRPQAQALMGDPDRMVQAVINLGSNAIKFTHKGSVSIQCHTRELEDNTVELSFIVTDTGIGFDIDILPSLFDKFTQADTSTTRKYGGTGLGLAITHSIAEHMNGSLEAQSAPGKGSTFTFRVCLSHSEDDDAPTSIDHAADKPLPYKNVLVAEDHDLSWKVINMVLQDLKLPCERAINGQEAVNMFRRKQYDLIILDCQMPIMSGLEAATKIRGLKTDGRRIPILALTAFQSDQNRKDCLAAGMDYYLTKPVAIEQIKSILSRHATA